MVFNDLLWSWNFILRWRQSSAEDKGSSKRMPVNDLKDPLWNALGLDFSNVALLRAWCVRKACLLGPDSGCMALEKERRCRDFQVSQWKCVCLWLFCLQSALLSDHYESYVFTLGVKVLERTRINLSRLRVSIILPLDHARTLLLKPAIRCASTRMFASLLRQSSRQVSPAVALLSANM